MRGGYDEVCGCFPTGRHYPGIAEHIAKVVSVVEGLAQEFAAADGWQPMPLALIDFETTGLEPERDRVIEVGIVLFENGQLTQRRNWLVNPGMPVPDESREVHGITDEELASAPTFDVIAPEVLGLLAGRIPVAYNAEFDRRFLQAEFARVGTDHEEELPPALRPDVVWIDPLIWVREIHKDEKSKKLVDVAARLNVSLERAHRAAGDAEAAGHVLLALASQMPRSYGELIRLQALYAARQDVAAWRSRW